TRFSRDWSSDVCSSDLWLRAAVARSQAEQDLVNAKNAFVSTKYALVQLTGIEEPFDVVMPEPPEAPEGAEDELVRIGLESRKDLQAARDQEKIADRLDRKSVVQGKREAHGCRG